MSDLRRRAHPLVTPNSIGLPLLDRGRRASAATRQVVAARWPAIAAAIERGETEAAIERMEALAVEMERSTGRDPEEWRDLLLLSRRVLYDDLCRTGGESAPAAARAALERCREWDRELAGHLAELAARIGPPPV